MDELARLVDTMVAVKAGRKKRLLDGESVDDRIARFVRLQQQSFQLLSASPKGLDSFVRRNFKARRSEQIDRVWRPVSVDRRTFEA